MNFFLKLAISVAVIVFCTQIGRRVPTLSGLIATMPLTGLIVMIWLYLDNPGDVALMENYTKGAVWGTLPSVLFFAVAFFGFHRHLPMPVVISASFGVWIAGAVLHQWLLR